MSRKSAARAARRELKRSSHAALPIPVHVVDLKAVARGAKTFIARQFTPSEAVALARVIEPLVREEAKRRQRAHGGTAPGRRSDSAGKMPRFRTRDILAAHCGLSSRSLGKALAVIEAAERDPKNFGPMARLMDETGNIDLAYRSVTGSNTARLLRVPGIFGSTRIGNVPLCEFAAPEIRWLVAFFAVIGDGMSVPPSDACGTGEFLSEALVKRAVKAADRARERPPIVTLRASGAALRLSKACAEWHTEARAPAGSIGRGSSD